MDNKAEGDAIRTVGWAILILVVLVIVVWAVHIGLFGGAKGSLEKFFDTEEIARIQKEVVNTDKDIELELGEKIIDTFVESFETNENDCIVRTDFNRFSDDFIVEFKESQDFKNRVRVFKEDSDFVATDNIDNVVYFDNKFIKTFRLNEFKEVVVGDVSYNLNKNYLFYKSLNGDIYFLDSFKIAILRGVFSDVFNKNVCDDGEIPETLSLVSVDFDVVPGTTLEEAQDLGDYFNSEFTYLNEEKNIFEIIRFVFELNGQKERVDFPIQSELNKLVLEMGTHIERYFGKDYKGLPEPFGDEENCWLMGLESNSQKITYGNSVGEKLSYREAKVTLSDGFEFDVGLSVSKEGCLPARKIDELLNVYRAPTGSE